MKRKKSFEIKGKLIDKIISVAYGDANIFDKLDVYIKARSNDEVKRLLDSYRATAEEVRQIGEEEYEDRSINFRGTQNGIIEESYNSFITDFLTIIFSRSKASLTVTIFIIIAVVVTLLVNRPQERNYTRQEIETADRQARKALAIVGKIFNQTQSTLEKEVLSERVAKPIREGIGIVNNLFNEGVKQ